MEGHPDFATYLKTIALILLAAKVCGSLAKRAGQPGVLGELLAGVVLGASCFQAFDPQEHTLEFLKELGVTILLFEIGLETDLKQLLKVGGSSFTVACVGVALPFVFGYGVCAALGYSSLISIVAGATLTATSVGITARVLSELNRLREPESQIILGAAVIDDVIGLIILAVVEPLTKGESVSSYLILKTTLMACGFLALTLFAGRLLLPPIINWVERSRFAGTPTLMAMICVMGVAWAAASAGVAPIIGAFAAGLILRETDAANAIEHGVAHLGQFFVPIFFVCVGASVDLRELNPLVAENHGTLKVGTLLIIAAMLGKFMCGYSPFWFKGRKHVIGIGMIPRGEVGLIFAEKAYATGVFDSGLFSAATMMVVVTTFIAPPLLRWTFPPVEPQGPKEEQGIESLVD